MIQKILNYILTETNDMDMRKVFISCVLTVIPLLAWCDEITFADKNVKALCVANWDTNGDGELSYEEAEAVTDLGQVFAQNESIKEFDEFEYFTGLTTITSYAFALCHNLLSISLPTSITSIGEEAFSGCQNLREIIIPESLISIERGAFVGCEKLVSVSIPNSVLTIGEDAFGACSSLAYVTIPESVSSIGSRAFSGCRNLRSVTIPNTLTSIVDEDFMMDVFRDL